MGYFRKLAHLQEQIGDKNLDALLDPENTGKVKNFCEQLLRAPFTVTVGGLIFEILPPECVSPDQLEHHEQPMEQEKFDKLIFFFLNHEWDIPLKLHKKRLVFLGPYLKPGGYRAIATAILTGRKGEEIWKFDAIRPDHLILGDDCNRFVRFLHKTSNPETVLQEIKWEGEKS